MEYATLFCLRTMEGEYSFPYFQDVEKPIFSLKENQMRSTFSGVNIATTWKFVFHACKF